MNLVVNMEIIGVTGVTGSGKTTFLKNLKTSLENREKKVTLIDVDCISREAFKSYPGVINATVDYLNARFGINIQDNKEFWERLMHSRSIDILMNDPLYFHICAIIDKIIAEQEESLILIDWAMLPKSKYFDLCTFRILIKPSNDEQRKLALKQRGDSIERTERRDFYKIDYEKYEFDQEIENNYSGEFNSINKLNGVISNIIK